jgi:hypothetical protein
LGFPRQVDARMVISLEGLQKQVLLFL